MTANWKRRAVSGRASRRARRWAHLFAWSTLVGGLIWGSSSWLFFDVTQPQLVIFLLIVLFGISTVALPAQSSYSPGYIAFASGPIIPMAIGLWTTGWPYSGWLSLLAILFLLVNVSFSRNLEKTITHSISADLDKSRFLAAVGHDLRQPLHAMGLFMESLKRELHDTRQQVLFENIQKSRDALTDMFEALLEFSRIETGALAPLVDHFELRPLLADLVDEFSGDAERKGLTLELAEFELAARTDC